jgi:hypothetical protein
MGTNGTSEDSDFKTVTTDSHYSISATTNSSIWEGYGLFWLAGLVCAVVVLIAVLVCYCMVSRCRNPDNARRRRNGSESRDLYQNFDVRRNRLMGDSLETVVNRPLLLSPEMDRQSAGKPEIFEDDYLKPVTADSLWLRQMEEIRLLPPAPPPFPRELESIPCYGENAYTLVIPDDATPLLTPRPIHEITLDPQLCELREESGYVVPSSLLENYPQQTVTETDLPPEPREITQERNEYQTRARTVVRSHGAVEQRPSMSAGRSLAEGASGSSDTRNETERSNDTSNQIYRSSLQLFLAPPTQHRSTQVSTSTPTVVLCIRTNHDRCFTNV